MPHKDPERHREYHRAYMRNVWYPANREAQIAASAASRNRRKEKLRAFKLARGCDRCGYARSAPALDFHHRPGEVKLYHISDGILNYAFERVLQEIAKCDLLCANCHRELTVLLAWRESR